ncbi:hypothetical protein DE146DRAFT_179247 [Phaeosphaeria sp. MPI-PUGE-AT-0046c]|nr:hypothetical protein DE146DRAFT_179247 [Phaeosphaeria sp. MPI-PUGE-AT-0046c]
MRYSTFHCIVSHLTACQCVFCAPPAVCASRTSCKRYNCGIRECGVWPRLHGWRSDNGNDGGWHSNNESAADVKQIQIIYRCCQHGSSWQA